MQKKSGVLAGAVLFLATGSAYAAPDLRTDKVFVAESKKTKSYIHDGLIVGGDRAIDSVTVRDIRHSSNPDFERVVIDIEGTRGGEPAAIARPPYFQVAVNPDEKRLVLTLWGNPKLAFSAKKVLGAFKKSALVSQITILPRVEEDSWNLVLGLRSGNPVEVFELTNPLRLIVDIKRAKK